MWRECHYHDRWANPKLKKIELKNDLIIAVKWHIHLPGCLMNCKRHCLLFLYHAWLTLFMNTSRLIQPSLFHYCEGNRGHLDSRWRLFRVGQLEMSDSRVLYTALMARIKMKCSTVEMTDSALHSVFRRRQSIVGRVPYSGHTATPSAI